MNFNLVAPFYEASAWLVFGNEHRRAEAFFLPEVPDNSRVLLVGGGAGHLLERLLRTRKPAAVAFLEPSSAMRRRAMKRVRNLPNATRVTFLEKSGDLAGHPPYDVLITAFVLDLFTNEQVKIEFLPPILAATAPGTRWLFTDFVQPQSRLQALLIKLMYAFFRVIAGIPARRLPDYALMFGQVGFQKKRSKTFFGGLIESALLSE